MLADESQPVATRLWCFDELTRLRSFSGPPAEFWPLLLAACGRLMDATHGILIVRDAAQPERLKKLGDWKENGHAERSTLSFNRLLPELTEECVKTGQSRLVVENASTPGSKHYALGVALRLQAAQEQCVAAFLLLNATEKEADEALVRLQLAADVPLSYQAHQASQHARNDVEKLAAVLDVIVLVNAEPKFLGASLAFCNGLATRFECDRVSLGWLESGYIELKSISRTERFDKKMAAVKALETAMEEAFDQNEEVLWPVPDGMSVVAKDHENFASEQKAGHVVSLPMRDKDKAIAVLTCERQTRAFNQIEVQQLRLACDQAIQRLVDLKRQDGWFGKRIARATRTALSKVLGPEHTWRKVLAILGFAALIVLFLPLFPYRVEGNFILRSDEVSYLTTPFDSYINTVEVRPGDVVQAGGPLLTLNTDDLELEEVGTRAELNRYLRETEKARATAALAEMRIAEALADQAKARLDTVRYRLGQAVIKSPFTGVVVEGDLRQRIGAPVKQGEALFKIARIDALYVEAEIHERDIHEVLRREAAQIAFVSQPKLKFPVKIVRIEPAAMPKEKETVFLVRLAFEGKAEPWWRPGMSGICKVDVEKRTLLWIISHRTVDFLRMLFWW